MSIDIANRQSGQKVPVVIAAFFIQALIIGCMFGYGVFFKSLEEELGWSRTLLSAASSLGFLVMGAFAFVGGRLSDYYGPRWVLTATGLLTGVGYILMSNMQTPWELLLYFAVFIGLGLSTHDVVTLSTVASWYRTRRGLVTGIVKTGTACGQVVVPLLVTVLIVWVGWRTAMLVTGVVAGSALVLLAQMMERPNAPMRQSSSSTDVGGLSVSQARRTSTLWKLCIIQFCFFPALMSIPLHIVAHATDLGMTTENGALVLASIGAYSVAGRLAIGIAIDKLGGKLALQLCLIPLAVSLFLLLIIENPNRLFFLALIYGFAHGGLFTVISPTVAEYFGMRAHGAIFGIVLFFGTLGGAAGPLLVGVSFDQFGSYSVAFSILGILATIGLAVASSLRVEGALASHSIDS